MRCVARPKFFLSPHRPPSSPATRTLITSYVLFILCAKLFARRMMSRAPGPSKWTRSKVLRCGDDDDGREGGGGARGNCISASNQRVRLRGRRARWKYEQVRDGGSDTRKIGYLRRVVRARAGKGIRGKCLNFFVVIALLFNYGICMRRYSRLVRRASARFAECQMEEVCFVEGQKKKKGGQWKRLSETQKADGIWTLNRNHTVRNVWDGE